MVCTLSLNHLESPNPNETNFKADLTEISYKDVKWFRTGSKGHGPRYYGMRELGSTWKSILGQPHTTSASRHPKI
jgi:hypothetical protein